MAVTAKEKKFIDEVIFLHFNDDERFMWEQTRKGALHAGYELPENKLKAQEKSKELFKASKDMQDYYNEQWAYFNALLQDKRTVWGALVALESN